MISHYLLLLMIYFSGRLFFSKLEDVIQNDSNNWKEIVQRSIFGLVLVFICSDAGDCIILYTFLVIMITADCIRKPKKLSSGYNYLIRAAFSTLVLAVTGALITKHFNLFTNPLYLLQNIDPGITARIVLVLTGYIAVLKEGTIIIRLVLNRIKAEPQKADAPMQKDEEEYDRGKLIGILERTFIYFLILLGQIGAITVIIALKSLARFKELDNKDFAEYFLIGSLLSLLTAAVPAVIVNYLLNIL